MRFSVSLLVALCACGPGVNDLKLEAPPVARIRAKVDLEGIRAAGYDGRLLVGLLWAQPQAVPPACRVYADVPEIAAHCSQTFAVKLGVPPLLAPFEPDADGVVELVLQTLPPAAAGVGNARGRVGYGSIIVAADVDSNGVFEPWGAMNQTESNQWTEPDRVVAASFSTLYLPQERVVLREGAWNPLSLFLPLFGCEPPPVGFSRLATTLDLSGGEPASECKFTDLDSVFNVPAISEQVADEMRCSSWVSVVHPDQFHYDPESSEGVCLSGELFFEPAADPCRSPSIVPLAGCHDGRASCDAPDWDVRDQAPDWWPCG